MVRLTFICKNGIHLVNEKQAFTYEKYEYGNTVIVKTIIIVTVYNSI